MHVDWRGGDAGREAGGFRVLGRHAEGVGPGKRPRAAHTGGPLCLRDGVAVTPDGKRAVSAFGDKTLKVWDLETARALRTLEGHSTKHLFCQGRGGDAGREAGGFRVMRTER